MDSKKRRDRQEVTSGQVNQNARSAKRQRHEPTSTGSLTAISDNLTTKTASTQLRQIPKDEEIFPRGGASLLTPLELKQVQVDATRDVLFEQGVSSQTLPAKTAQDDRLQQRRPRDKRAGAGTTTSTPQAFTDAGVRIEGLNYKRLVPGALVLGQVAQITDQDIALALPNNLMGYVPITSISGKVSEQLEAMLSEDVSNHAADSSNERLSLRSLFVLGQYLRAYVVSNEADATSGVTGNRRRRIELSLLPELSNQGITPREIVPNTMIMASVTSVEDHGLIMDLGLSKHGLRGFLSSKELPPDTHISSIQDGMVWLCMVTGLSSNGLTVKLSAGVQRPGPVSKCAFLASAPTIDAFLPGTAVEMLVTEVTPRGLVGMVMGHVIVTADLFHSGVGSFARRTSQKIDVGTKVKGRIMYTFPASAPYKLGVSCLDHIVALSSSKMQKDRSSSSGINVLPISSILEAVVVTKVEPSVGLLVEMKTMGLEGFVHISCIADNKIDSLNPSKGLYHVGSAHRARIIGYNAVDDIYLVSLEPSVISQRYLRVDDVVVGDIVSGEIIKLLIGAGGVEGILLKLSDGVTGLVPEMHISDVSLKHPEKKYRNGMRVTARVMSVDAEKRQIRMTLKKTLVNAERSPWKSYEEIDIGGHGLGTIVSILPTGALVQFSGTVRGFLPVAEMSEAFIQDPSQHFRLGQVINVRALQIDMDASRLTVSCKKERVVNAEQRKAFDQLVIGERVSARVVAKSEEDVSLEVSGCDLPGIIALGHLTDGSISKASSAFKLIRLGQILKDLVVLEKNEKQFMVVLTNKPSLLSAATKLCLVRDIEDIKVGNCVSGFVKNITANAVFVGFGGTVTGYLPRTQMDPQDLELTDFGLSRLQSISCHVTSLDVNEGRFTLSKRDPSRIMEKADVPQIATADRDQVIRNPVDPSLKMISDLHIGRLTMARITSVKDTQINVQLGDNVQGRVDISQIFDAWEDIKDRKRPLGCFTAKENIKVRLLGLHDARNHRFLPISHRAGKTLVFELSAKPSEQSEVNTRVLALDDIHEGSSWIGFVNNVNADCLWVNLSPNVRGRVDALEVSDDVLLSKDLAQNFPVGSAIKVQAIHLDVNKNRLDLSARSGHIQPVKSFEDLAVGMVLPARVTKISGRYIMVHLSDAVCGAVALIDMADDFSLANSSAFSRNEIIRVSVRSVDPSHKRLRLSTRASKVLDSTLPSQDPELSSISDVQVNDVYRGIVKSITDKGVFVHLGGELTAFVKISDLSDRFLKDWKSFFELDQLVKGKITLVDKSLNHVQMSLKPSVTDTDHVAPTTFEDVAVGQIVSGRIRKVESFGVFIVIEGSANVSGLCHHSEMADIKTGSVESLYTAGDAVKARVLKIDLEKRRINFGLKVSYLQEPLDEGGLIQASDHPDGQELDESNVLDSFLQKEEQEPMSESGSSGHDMAEGFSGRHSLASGVLVEDLSRSAQSDGFASTLEPLSGGLFEWVTTPNDADKDPMTAIAIGTSDQVKKKRRKPVIKIDRTGELDVDGPKSLDDFERLLLTQSSVSELWIGYMAHHLDVGEVDQARLVAERALKMIDIRDDDERLNVWMALLNLESRFGSDETFASIFRNACQHSDSQEVHERLASVYIQSGKFDKAEDLFKIMIKKFSQSPTVWYNFAHFLYNTLVAPDTARALLPRALQSLPPHTHLNLTVKFASLEFRSPNGSPERGRTIFEGLLASFPRKADLWHQLADLEVQQGDEAVIRNVFERGSKSTFLSKPKIAKAWFRRWSEWEQACGNTGRQGSVRAQAADWVAKAARKSGDKLGSE